MLTHLSKLFIKMGDTGLCTDPAHSGVLQPSQWFDVTNTADGTRMFTVPLTSSPDTEPFPSDATAIRLIVTACGRYPTPNPNDNVIFSDNSFPVAMVNDFPSTPPWPTSFTILARNTDSAQQGGYASFMWLAIAQGGSPRNSDVNPFNLTLAPMNQIFPGQAAPFPATKNSGDHQFFPNAWDPATGENTIPGGAGIYNFNNTFGRGPGPAPLFPFTSPAPGATTSTAAAEPPVFATANNVGWGSHGEPQHNAAAVPRVGAPLYFDIQADILPLGFRLIARTSDTAAGSCGFNWVALKQVMQKAPPPSPGQPWLPADPLVDMGQLPDALGAGFNFSPTGITGDWASAEIQFSAPFNTVPVVLITPRVTFGMGAPGATCAPVPIAQNVTRFGFTLTARNSDTNPNVNNANFDWVAFGS
jgi:hypothetical protein